MKRNHYVKFNKYWRDIPQGEKDNAIENYQFIICVESSPKYPLMTIAVYEPIEHSPENLKAIFRNIEDAILFVEAFLNHNNHD